MLVAHPMRGLVVTLSVLTCLASLYLEPRPAHALEHRVYENRIDDEATWMRLSKEIASERFTKFIIDLKSGSIYFIDVNLFKLHADFVFSVLLKTKRTAELNREYNRNYTRDKPRFILGYLTHHLQADRYTYAFWEGDDIDAEGIKKVYTTLQASFFKAEIAFRPDSPKQEKQAGLVKSAGLAVLTNDALYKSSDFQAFNQGTAVGKLRIVPVGTPYESLIFERGDIVILQESYPDISPVSGILSTVFSTPLSHVNLRARAWKVPNAGFVHARRDYAKLDGQMVRLHVDDKGHELRLASAEEVDALKAAAASAKKVRLPKADTYQRRLKMLTELSHEDWRAYGAKSANLGAIATAQLKEARVPPGFAIPFSFYLAHMQRHGLDLELSALLRDPKWKADATWRRAAVEGLRKSIREAELTPRLLDEVEKLINLRFHGAGVFVRSSTNAEDLDGFNGAGLYDTIGNVQGREALAEAIKQVWASLWNFRAVEERELYGIDHRHVYSAVLVQVGVNATAAGVLVTVNLFDPSDKATYTINAKRGLGIRVVEGATVPEQVLFDTKNFGTKIISRSDDPTMLVFDESGGITEVPNPHRGVILDEGRAKRLSMGVKSFVRRLPTSKPLDVEWALDGEKIWILAAPSLALNRTFTGCGCLDTQETRALDGVVL